MEKEDKIRIKQPKTFNQQLDILKNRNLVIEDEDFAIKILSRINYYRFSAYTLTLKKQDQFHEDVTFNHVFSLYEFDRKLRLLLLAQLELLEVMFRTKISYHLAHKYGALAHLDINNFKNPTYFESMKDQLQKEIERSKEIFVSHHKSKYEGVFPIWVAIEVTSFSLLSKIYSNLKDTDQLSIAKNCSSNRFYLKNWLYALSTLRNICAHYGRLYNRLLPIHFKLSKTDQQQGIQGNTIFGAIYVMGKIFQGEPTWRAFVTELSALIEAYDKINLRKMGFPNCWEETMRKISKKRSSRGATW